MSPSPRRPAPSAPSARLPAAAAAAFVALVALAAPGARAQVLDVGDASISEGDAGTAVLTFTVSVAPVDAGAEITFDFATVDVDATAGADYVAATGTATIPAGASSATISIDVSGDLLDETDETFDLVLSNPSANATIGTGTALGTITDDDTASISLADASVTEGGTAALAVILSTASSRDITVDFATVSGTAGAADFAAATGTLTFVAGDTTETIAIATSGDTVDEDDEAFTLTLSNAQGAAVADGTAAITILDDDAPPDLTIGDVTRAEGAGPALVPVTLSAPSEKTITVSFATAAGSAVAADFTAASGTLTFAPGDTTADISVTVTNDVLDEDDETLTLSLSAAQNVATPDTAATVTITDDDAEPTLAIAGATVSEDDGTAALTVTLSAVSGRTVTVDFATAAGTAGAADFTAASGTLTFLAGDTSATVLVALTDDLLDELDETFTVEIAAPLNAAILGGTASVTVQDDNDTPPSIAVADQAFGEAGGAVAVVVTLDRPSGRTVTVDFDTSETAAGAVIGADFNDTAGTLTFAPGETSKTAALTILDDAVDEDDETLRFNLSSATGGASIGDNRGDITIRDDEAAPTLSVAPASDALENAAPPGDDVVFILRLSHPSAFSVGVDVDTRNGTATAALPGAANDYDGVSRTITFAPGETEANVAVDSNADALDEDDETLFLDLSNPTAGRATLGTATASGAIVDDDAPPVLSVADAAVTEGNSGAALLTFDVALSGPSGRTVTALLATAAGTAAAGADFTTTSTTLTFAPGETTRTFSVPVLTDVLDEDNETFTVTIANETNATVTVPVATGTITDDDTPPSVSIGDVIVAEGNTGTTDLGFSIALSAPSGRDISLTVATSDGSARAPVDYASRSGTITIAAGQTGASFVVTANGDDTFEGDDTLNVTLSSPVNAAIADGSGRGTITNDDAEPTVSILDATLAAEGNAGTSNLRFTIELTNASDSLIAVNLQTADGTAVQGADYAPVAGGSAVIPAGQRSTTFDVVVGGDALDEPDETFFLRIPSATTPIGDGEALGLITDDDVSPTVSIVSPAPAFEGSGATTLRFDVALNAVSGQEVRVTLTRADVTATVGTDYTIADSQELVFAPGVTLQQVTASVLPDLVDEDDEESFTLTLAGAVNAVLGTAIGTGAIRDDDETPSLSIGDVILNPEETGPFLQDAVFTVTLSAASGRTVRVTATTLDGTAIAPDDYVARQEQLIFAPGDTTRTFIVGVVRDSAQEPDEELFVQLAAAENATLSDDTGVGTVLNDDAGPTTNTLDGQLDGPYQTTEEVALNVTAAEGVLVNDEDVDGDPLVARVIDAPAADEGTLTFQDDGSFTFTPATDFAGVATFTYVARDGFNESAPQEVHVTVVNVNDDPAIDPEPVVVGQTEDDPDPAGLDVGELAATFVITDPDAGDLPGIAITGLPDAAAGVVEISLDDGATWTAVTSAGDAEATLVPASGRVRLRPAPDDTPTADVTVRAWDASDGLAAGSVVAVATGDDAHFSATPGTLRFVVEPVNDAPRFVAPTPEGPLTAVEGTALVVQLAAADVDDDETALVYSLGLGTVLPAAATFDAATGELRLVAAFTDAGTYAAELVVTDAAGATDVRQIAVTVAFLDADADGLPDTWETLFDLDVTSDDSDGDLISDRDEAGVLGPLTDLGEPVDTDGDQIIDALDPDSDDDGVLDRDEAGDARLDTPPLTSDGDDTEDFRDDNADDDLHADGDDNCRTVPNDDQEDLDGDGVGDACDADADGDRLADELEPGLLLDPRNPDEDGDGIVDGDEVVDPQDAADSDGDGIIDALESDSDDDGLDDAAEAGDDLPETAPVDTDSDGTPDFQDTDSDDDTVPDDDDNCRITANQDQKDLDLDGVGDACLQVCGDGRRQEPEECDDGNSDETDQCTNDCERIVRAEICNGVDDDFDGRIDLVDTSKAGGVRSVCPERDITIGGGGVGAACGCSSGVDLALPSFLALLALLSGRARRTPRRRRPRAPVVAFLLPCLGVQLGAQLAAHGVRAAEGLQVQQFTPAAGGDSDLVVVEGTRVNGHLRPTAGVLLDYSYRTLTVRDDATDASTALLDHRLNAHVVASLSLFHRAQVAIQLPVTLFQKEGVDEIFVPPTLSPVALGDLRLSGRFSLLEERRGRSGPGLAVGAAVTAPTGDPAQLGGYGFLTVEPSLIAGWRFGDRGFAVANVGYLVRPRQELLGFQVGNEATVHVGGLWAAVPQLLDVIGEVNGRVAADPGIPVRGATSPFETLVAGRWHVAAGHAVTAGAAVGLTSGYGTPLVRAFAGYAFTLPGDDEPAMDPAHADADDDAIPDARDRCPEIAEDTDGIQDDDGCPDLDADEDAVPDNLDACPEVPEDKDGFEDDDGCADLDHDGDGIDNDRGDACPDAPEDRDGFEDGDGCPDPDNDKDGVDDASDQCPDVVGPVTGGAAAGCPDAGPAPAATASPAAAPAAAQAAQAAQPTAPAAAAASPSSPAASATLGPPASGGAPAITIELPQRIYFQVNGTDVTPEGRRLLEQVAATLQRNQDVRVEVQGHSDALGATAVNDNLSLRRAQAVIDILVKKGLSRHRFLIAVLSDTEPLAPNDTPQGRALNRRVQFRVLPP